MVLLPRPAQLAREAIGVARKPRPNPAEPKAHRPVGDERPGPTAENAVARVTGGGHPCLCARGVAVQGHRDLSWLCHTEPLRGVPRLRQLLKSLPEALEATSGKRARTAARRKHELAKKVRAPEAQLATKQHVIAEIREACVASTQ